MRTAVRLRDDSARKRAKERPSATLAESSPVPAPDDPSRNLAWDELRPVLHEEVNRLPEKYRVPVVLSYLEGRTNEEAAALLDWPVGTLKVRLLRARDLLRSRLSRRGVALSAAMLVTGLHQGRAMADTVGSGLAAKLVELAISHRFARRAMESAATLAEAAEGPAANGLFRARQIEGRRPLRSSRPLRIMLLLLLAVLAVIAGNSLAVSVTGMGFAELPAVRRILTMRFNFAWVPRSLCH